MLKEFLGKDRLGYLGYLLFRALGVIPFQIRSSVGAFIGYTIALFPSKALKIAELQIAKFLNHKNPRSLARQSFAQAGRTSFECVDLRAIIKDPGKFITISNPPELERILSKKKGIVALTAHVSNFDAMGAYFAANNLKLMAVAKQLRNPSLQVMLELLRSSFGFKTIWRASRSGIKRILEALDQGWTVAALIDHDTNVSSLQVPFFNIPANTPIALVELAKKSDSLVVSAFVTRKSAYKFEIHVEEIPNSMNVEEILTEYNLRLEAIIRRYPEQWSWTHKRWRTVENERLSGKEYLNYLENLQAIK